jgi:hypothetical protein
MDTASQSLPAEETLTKAMVRAKSKTWLEKLGIHISRYGLVITLLLIGVLKFTTGEAQGIQPLVHPALGGEQPADVLALSNLQRSRRFQSNRIDRNRRWPAYRRAALFRETFLHRQHWSHHHLRAYGEFSLVDTGSVPVLARIPVAGGCGPIPHQGSRAPGRSDLDRGRSTRSSLGHSNFQSVLAASRGAFPGSRIQPVLKIPETFWHVMTLI